MTTKRRPKVPANRQDPAARAAAATKRYQSAKTPKAKVAAAKSVRANMNRLRIAQTAESRDKPNA